MRFAEELVLLLLNEESGYLEQVSGWNLSCVLAGAVLADLALELRIDTDLESLTLLDDTPVGDALLDPTLAMIAGEHEPQPVQYWVEKTAATSDEILDATLARLVDKGILDRALGGFWSFSRAVLKSVGSTSDDGSRADVRQRVVETILGDEVPAPRDAIVTGLAHACDAFRFLLQPEDYEASLGRIELIGGLDLIGRSVAAAVSATSIRRPNLGMARPPPRLNVLDLLRKDSFWQGNMPKLMADLYRDYGPVFAIGKPFSHKPMMYVLVGTDANIWVNRHGRLYLRSKDYIAGLEGVFGAARSLPGMDGAEHYRMRKAQRAAYSRRRLEGRLDEMLAEVRLGLDAWNEGEILTAVDACRALMCGQTSKLAVSVDTSEYMDELLKYKDRALLIHVQKLLPKFMLSTPRMLAYRRRIDQVFDLIGSSHTPAQRKDKPRDLIDDLMSLHASDPQFFPETDTKFAFVMSLITPIYTGNALAFVLFELFSRPDIYRRVKAEAAVLFGDGDPQHEDFTREAIDVTHRLFLETLRLYPGVPLQLRDAMNTFVLQGFEVPVGSRVLVASTATHYLEENYPEPLSFDIGRYLPERDESRKHGAYATFGLGTHACLGMRWVELQMAVNILMIAHYFDLDVLPSSYPIKMNPMPTNAPRKALKFRVKSKRPIPQAAALAQRGRRIAPALRA